MPKAHDKLLTALAGEYYVAAELCRRGYVASLTLKNYPKVDIFALDPETQVQTTIQVKAVRARSDQWRFFVPADAAEYKGVFVFVIVRDAAKPDYEVFILPGVEVARLSRRSRDDYIASHPGVKAEQPLMLGRTDLAPFQDNWGLIFPANRAQEVVVTHEHAAR